METASNEIIGNALIALGKRVRAGKCELTQEQSDLIFENIQQAIDVTISKEEACALLGVSRSTFDSRVAAGELPEGRHYRGFKEKRYSKREIIQYGKRG